MLGALSLFRLTIASSVEPRLCGLFPACKSADYIIRYSLLRLCKQTGSIGLTEMGLIIDWKLNCSSYFLSNHEP